MTIKAVFDPNFAQPYNQTRQIWHCSIPVEAGVINRATFDDLTRSDYWSKLVNSHHVEVGDLLIAQASDSSFLAIFLIRGVDKRNLRLVLSQVLVTDFKNEPLLIGLEIIIRKAGKGWSVFKKLADRSQLELIKGGFAGADEAKAWAERLGAHNAMVIDEAVVAEA